MKQQWSTAGLAWHVYQGSGVHKVKYQTKFDKVKTTIFMLTKITKHACHNDSIYVAWQLVLV